MALDETLYTVLLAANTEMALTVENDSNAAYADVYFSALRRPSADGQVWRVVSRDDAGGTVLLQNLMSGKYLALPSREWLAEYRRSIDTIPYGGQTRHLKAEWEAEVRRAEKAARDAKQDYERPEEPDWYQEYLRLTTYGNGYPVCQCDFVPGDAGQAWTPVVNASGTGTFEGVGGYPLYELQTTVSRFSHGVVTSGRKGAVDPDGAYMWERQSLASSYDTGYCDLLFVHLAWKIPDGAYQIVLPSGNLLGLANDTKANGATFEQVAVTGDGDAPLRTVFIVKNLTDADGLTGLCTIRNAYSGGYVCTQDWGAQAGRKLVQWDKYTDDDGVPQQWGMWLAETVRASRSINGVSVPGYRLRTPSGTSLVVAATDTSYGFTVSTETLGRVGDVYTYLYFKPVDVVAGDLGSPSDVCAATELGGVPTNEVVAPSDGHVVLWPTFRYPSKRVKLRWRLKGSGGSAAGLDLDVLASAFGGTANALAAAGIADGQWRDYNGSTSNGGLGDASGSGFEATMMGGRGWCPTPIEFDVLKGTSRTYEVEIAVRGVESDYLGSGVTATGPEVTGVVRVYPPITASVSGCTWSPDGLRLGYTLSGNVDESVFVRVDSIKLGGREVLAVPVSVSGASQSGVLTVPVSALREVPADGAAISGTLASGRSFGGESAAAFSETVRYAAGFGLSVRPSCRRADGLSVKVSLGATGVGKVWYQVETDDGTRFASADDLGGGVFACYPPLGERCRLYCVAEDGDDWGTAVEWLPVVEGDGGEWEVFNWPGGWCALRWNLEEGSTYSRNYETLRPDGLDYDMTVFTGGAANRVTVSGLVVPDMTRGNDGFSDYEALLRCGHATWRSPYGRLARVAVVGGNAPRTRTAWGNVTVELMREDL